MRQRSTSLHWSP
ncbi:hypothetical protein LINPERPRIM_LOCUS37799 [Linum perenne]